MLFDCEQRRPGVDPTVPLLKAAWKSCSEILLIITAENRCDFTVRIHAFENEKVHFLLIKVSVIESL